MKRVTAVLYLVKNQQGYEVFSLKDIDQTIKGFMPVENSLLIRLKYVSISQTDAFEIITQMKNTIFFIIYHF